jgi:hypothetical protein
MINEGFEIEVDSEADHAGEPEDKDNEDDEGESGGGEAFHLPCSSM